MNLSDCNNGPIKQHGALHLRCKTAGKVNEAEKMAIKQKLFKPHLSA
jgi:hypothetical protein